MEYRIMSIGDISAVVPMYIDYYNNVEGSCWNEETASRRIRQLVTMEGSHCIIMENSGEVLGFAMGFFQQYDDLVSYVLEEILIRKDRQNGGLGSMFLKHIEEDVRKNGAMGIELKAVKDEMHDHFYSKAGFKNASNFVLKVKWFE